MLNRTELIQEAERVRLKEILKREADAGNSIAVKLLLDVDTTTAEDNGIRFYKGFAFDFKKFTDKILNRLEAGHYFKSSKGGVIVILPAEDEIPAP